MTNLGGHSFGRPWTLDIGHSLVIASLVIGHSSGAAQPTTNVPPPMPRRVIAPTTNAPPQGESVLLEDGGVKFTLFIPNAWKAPDSGETILTAHFHTTVWFVIQEHVRRGAATPLLCFQLGEGSAIYRQPFEDTNRFSRVLRLVEGELSKRSTPVHVQITGVDVSSFSAGYGAVRELVKSPASFKMVRRIVLLDSMYAAFEQAPAAEPPRRPANDQIEVWAPFARAALKGEKTFVLTHSAVPTDKYASSGECATALLKLLEVPRELVRSGTLPATTDPEFPLQSRADRGDFHIWGYGGEDAQAHMTHARHMADVWRALD